MIYKNIMFIHIPRTGGNSFQKLLILNKGYDGKILVQKNQDGLNRFGISDDFTKYKHQKLNEYKKYTEIKKFNIVSCVREPTERLISLFFLPNQYIKFSSFYYKILSKMNIFTKDSFTFKQKIKFDIHQFKKFLNNKDIETQSNYLKINKKIYKDVSLLRFENYKKDVKRLFRKEKLKFFEVKINKKIHNYNYNEIIKKFELNKLVMDSKHFEDYKNFSYL